MNEHRGNECQTQGATKAQTQGAMYAKTQGQTVTFINHMVAAD